MKVLGHGRNMLVAMGAVFSLLAATAVKAEPIIVEAETYSDGSGVRIATTGDWYSGEGYVYFTDHEDTIEWNNVEVLQSGFYALTIHYRRQANNGVKFDVFVNGVKTPKSLIFVGNDGDGTDGAWEVDRTLRVLIPLQVGANTVKFQIYKAFYNSPSVDKLEISSIAESRTALHASLNAVNNHLMGGPVLTGVQWAEHKAVIEENIGVAGEGDSELVGLAFEIVERYETNFGPMFLNEATRVEGWGWDRRTQVPDVDTTMLAVMQGIVDYVYGFADNITGLRELVDGYRFESSDHFPGQVTSVPDSNVVHTSRINCSFPDTYGRVYAYGDTPARKPTGIYLPPGVIATMTVPSAMVGKGFRVRIGAHSYDMSHKPFVRRLDRSSISYGIDSTEMKLASPLGGAIYIEIPYLAEQGIQTVQIQNAVRSPLFSLESHRPTSLADWQNEIRSYGAPWADFITDKFQYNVPTSWIYAVDDPKSIMEEWDTCMDVITDLMGLPRIRGKEHLYLQVDVIIKSGVLSTGYPQTNQTYGPYDDFTKHSGHEKGFLDGPKSGTAMELHEMGHAIGMLKFGGENESVNNLLYAAVCNQQFGDDLNLAWRKSTPARTDDYYTFNTAAITWMTSENFLLEQSMTKPEMQYQFKGHARYVEIARLFGWEALGAYWKSTVDDQENGIEDDHSVDGKILRMSKAVGVDMTPLLQFWGVQPEDPAQLMIDTADAGLQPSERIHDMLTQYQSIIPTDNAAFQAHVLDWWVEEPTETNSNNPTPYYHNILFETYDEAYAAKLYTIMQNNIDTYFPDGRPGGRPFVRFISLIDGDEVSAGEDLVVTVDAFDDGGIDRVELQLDGVRVDPIDGEIAYEWNLGILSAGEYKLRAIAYSNDVDPDTGDKEEATTEIMIDVVSGIGNGLPEITTEAKAMPAHIAVDEAAELRVIAEDPDGDDLSYVWAQLSGPATVAISTPGSDTTEVTGFSAIGNYDFEVSISDGQVMITSQVTVSVYAEGGNIRPSGDSDTVSTPQDTALVITLEGFDPEAAPLNYSIIDRPTNGKLDTHSGKIVTYTPNSGYTGTDSFTFRVNDGTHDSDRATVTIKVLESPSGANDGQADDDGACGCTTTDGTPGTAWLILLCVIGFHLRRRLMSFSSR